MGLQVGVRQEIVTPHSSMSHGHSWLSRSIAKEQKIISATRCPSGIDHISVQVNLTRWYFIVLITVFVFVFSMGPIGQRS